jgi:hypothetical protein
MSERNTRAPRINRSLTSARRSRWTLCTIIGLVQVRKVAEQKQGSQEPSRVARQDPQPSLRPCPPQDEPEQQGAERLHKSSKPALRRTISTLAQGSEGGWSITVESQLDEYYAASES